MKKKNLVGFLVWTFLFLILLITVFYFSGNILHFLIFICKKKPPKTYRVIGVVHSIYKVVI